MINYQSEMEAVLERYLWKDESCTNKSRVSSCHVSSSSPGHVSFELTQDRRLTRGNGPTDRPTLPANPFSVRSGKLMTWTVRLWISLSSARSRTQNFWTLSTHPPASCGACQLNASAASVSQTSHWLLGAHSAMGKACDAAVYHCTDPLRDKWAHACLYGVCFYLC